MNARKYICMFMYVTHVRSFAMVSLKAEVFTNTNLASQPDQGNHVYAHNVCTASAKQLTCKSACTYTCICMYTSKSYIYYVLT